MKARIVHDHVLEIDVMYFEKEAIHKWRAVCTCGFQSAWSLSPKTADRELELHRNQYPHTHTPSSTKGIKPC